MVNHDCSTKVCSEWIQIDERRRKKRRSVRFSRGKRKSIQHSCVHVSVGTRMTIIQRTISKLAGKNNNVLVQI